VDPLFLIDFIRQIINHKVSSEVMTHVQLKGLPIWMNLDPEHMLSMKRLLQHFELVMPSEETMKQDSDLLVPLFWQTKTPADWLFWGNFLRLGGGLHTEDVEVRVHWELHFENVLPATVFDRVIVASYSSIIRRDVGPDWIVYSDKGVWACRLMVGRDLASHDRTLRLEAVLARGVTTPKKVSMLWATFGRVCEALSKVLRGYPGLVISSCARDGNGSTPSLRTIEKEEYFADEWLPPMSHHTKCRDLLTFM
jgi:hypothetical protein